LLGQRFTVADLNVAAVLLRWADMGGADFPNATAWHQRCLARPAAQRAMALRQKAG
jgi:glutathione S-transferase